MATKTGCMKQFPFLSQRQSIVLLRLSLALIFLLHAIVRIGNGTVQQFGGYLNEKGFSYGVVWVWAITIFEIAGSVLLAMGYFVQWLSAGFIFLMLAGIVIIHYSNGWFVGEHGTGGIEYSFLLVMAFIVVAAVDGEGKK
jgi:putative oxidoreductase